MDAQMRRNFINTLKETAEVAEACGEFAAQGVLLSLMAALETGHEKEFLSHVCEFAEREIEWIQAQRNAAQEAA
jgi:hypothetical protein